MSRLDFLLFFQCPVSKENPRPDYTLIQQSLVAELSKVSQRTGSGLRVTTPLSLRSSSVACALRASARSYFPPKKKPTQTGPSGHGSICLSDVLHVPGAPCNLLGAPIVCEYTLNMDWNDPSSCSIRDRAGQQLAYFRYASDGRQLAVRLSGPPVGPRVGPPPLSASIVYDLKATWSDGEQCRWIVYKQALFSAQQAPAGGNNSSRE